jgi:exodeoxyribonuclease-5
MILKTKIEFYSHIKNVFPLKPTLLQDEFFKRFSDFIYNSEKHRLFLLKGYAGTGKTTIISTIVNNLKFSNKRVVLLAPTGRAAKVIANYSKKEAKTIHKQIYHPKRSQSGGVQFNLKKNTHTNTLFFVDEASMIPETINDKNSFNNRSLLQDLLDYVYLGKMCQLVLIGDTAQLPPINLDVSPALNFDKLTLDYNKEVSEIELTEVMRQQEYSGILNNATILRNKVAEYHKDSFQFNIKQPDLIRLIDGYDIEDAINQSYDSGKMEDTAIIVRSNKRANLYNRQIRQNIIGLESDIATGDFIMVVKNNYYWLDDQSKAGFIANGDTCEILEIYNRKELYGFHFADAKIRMIDYPNQKAFETVLLLDTLTVNAPSLSFEESNKLYHEVAKDYAHLKSKYKVFQSIKENKYFNALQIKFSYAITCHKSQGGQWKNVFIEKPWLPQGENIEYWRWLYTALTRAKEKVFLIGYRDEDFLI